MPKFLSDEGIYEEKQWVADNAGQGVVPGIDARGKHKNGNFWRHFGTGGEAASYSDVPQEAAESSTRYWILFVTVRGKYNFLNIFEPDPSGNTKFASNLATSC